MNVSLVDMLKVAIKSPGTEGLQGLPLLIWGPPGAAKTALVKQVSKELGLPLEIVLLSVREPADVAGLPVLTEDSMRLEPPAWARRLEKAGEGILFFDELSCAAPAVQAAALRIVAERVVGELTLPPGVRVVAATNTAEQAAGGWDLAAPLANRFVHCEHHGPKLNDWIDWLISTSGKAADGEAEKQATTFETTTWRRNYAKATGAVTSFLTRKPMLLGPNVPDDPSRASQAWESPRTWELATRSLSGAWCHGVDPIIFVEGAVGQGPAQEFLSFLSEMDLPDPRQLLRGEVKFKHSKSRLDRSVAVLSAVAAYTQEEPKLAPAAWGVIGCVISDAPDIAVPAARTLVKARLTDSEEATKVLAKIQPLLSAVNIGGGSK